MLRRKNEEALALAVRITPIPSPERAEKPKSAHEVI
jgi:hypothetical protein